MTTDRKCKCFAGSGECCRLLDYDCIAVSVAATSKHCLCADCCYLLSRHRWRHKTEPMHHEPFFDPPIEVREKHKRKTSVCVGKSKKHTSFLNSEPWLLHTRDTNCNPARDKRFVRCCDNHRPGINVTNSCKQQRGRTGVLKGGWSVLLSVFQDHVFFPL